MGNKLGTVCLGSCLEPCCPCVVSKKVPWRKDGVHINEQFMSRSLQAGIMEPQASRKAVDLRLQVEADLPTLQTDPGKVQQILYNLISNAIKFARPGVAPRVEITCETLDPTELGAQQGYLSSQICEIVIEDNGIGFEPKYAEKIFAPFQRLHGRSSSYKGTGIGLAICRKIVERHRGTIAAIGLPDQGATFRIRLPLEQHSLQEEQRT